MLKSSLILLLIAILLAVPSSTRDVYVDSESTSSQPSGTKTDPYPSLQQLISILKDSQNRENTIQVYLKPRPTAYKISNIDEFLFDGSSSTNLLITSWSSDPESLNEERDCDFLPIIDGSDLRLSLESMNLVSITSIKFINMKGSIQIKNSKDVSLHNLCLDDLPSVSQSFFNLAETRNLEVQRVIATVSNGTEIIKYTNTKSTNIVQKVLMTDLTLLLINNTNKLSADTLNESYFKFVLNNPDSLSATKNTLTLSRISLQGKGTSQVFPVFASVFGWDNVQINKLNISDQDFIANRGGVLEFNNVGNLTISDTEFFHNVIFSQSLLNLKEKISFFYLKNVGSLSLYNTNFDSNLINGIKDIETNFRFLLSDVLGAITVKNFTAKANTVLCLMYLLRVKTINVDVPISMNFDNITIEGNQNDNSNFYFIKFSEAKILSFQATNFYIAQNRLSGRLFEISTLGNINLYGLHLSDTVISHKVAYFENINIINNSNFTNFAMLLFRVSNPNTIPTDFVPDYEYYTLKFHKLIIEKNNFFKGRDRDWLDQLSFLQVAGAQVYIQNSTIKDSLFASYDFLSLYKELGSVFFVNSTVENSIFAKAHFIITRYEAIMVTMGSFFNLTDGRVQAIYRYGFVIDSNFSDIEISGGSLFTFNNAFVLFNSNNFERMFFLNSRLLKAGDFRPPGYNIDDVKYIRNHLVEKQSMSINPALYDLYLSSLALLQTLYQDTVYFYLLRGNKMTKFDVFSKNLIKFEDYEARQSFICCISNVAYDFNVPDTSTNLIDLSGSVEAFNFYRNTIDKLDGDGSILRFTSLTDNKYFMFRRNIVRNTWGPSILLASGAELSTMNITDNTVHDNIFSNSVISLSFDMIAFNQTVFFVNNNYTNNTIVVTEVDLNSKSAFIELSLEASRGGEFFIIDRCTFTDTTYLNNRTFLQYGQLNAMFSFLMANSSLLIRNSIFDKVSIISPGNDAFYVASSLIVVLNCTFNNYNVQSGQSVFNLVSTTAIFRNNTFNQIFIPFGKSVMYISPSPFLQEIISLDMTENRFTHCKCGLENVQISANVMLVQKANITLSLINNLFSDAFELNPVFYFLNTTFINSVVTHSTLQSLDAKNDENFMYEVYYSSGSIQFINETIENKIPGISTDVFLKCTESPSLSIVLSDLTWAEGSFKNSIRLANIDSGSLTILNTVIDDFTYHFKTATEGMIINAGSAKSQLSSLTITLKNVTFSNLRLIKSNPADKSAIGVAGFMGSGEQRDTIWNFEVINCTFSGLDGVAGVYIEMPTVFNILIEDSLFNAIKGRFGTAIDFFPLTSYKSKLIITNNTFSNNYASKAGGAIYITNSSYVMVNNTFINNRAADIGGAILLDGIARTNALMEDNKFEGNKAILGDDVASQPYKLAIRFIFPNQTTVYARNGLLVDEHHHPMTIRNVSRVALNISLLDLDGLPTQDTSSTATRYIIVNLKNHATITSFNCTKQYCYINSLNLTLSGLHGAPLGVTIQFFSELGTSANFRLQDQISFNIHPCDAGESFNENTKTCDYCGIGTYSLDPKVACQNCPDNTYCPGGNILIPQRGYWRANDHTAEITQCRKDGITRCNASRELSEAYMQKQCNPGYAGPRCEACDSDNHFVESGLLQCKKCKNVLVSFAATMLTALGYTFFRLYCVRKLYLANKSFCSADGDELDKLERTESNYYVRLLIVYTQIISLLYLFHMEVREFFGEHTRFGNPSEFMLVKLECSMEFLGIPYYQFIYVSTVITFLSPILQYLAIFVLAKIFAKRLFEEASEAKYFFRLSVLYLVMSEQPKVVGFMTSYLSCGEVEGFVGSFIALHPNVSCDDSQYSIFKYYLVIPCLLIWTVGIPLYFFLSLFFRREKLGQLGVRVSLGGLYNIYKTKHYYWGTVTMALQVSISYVTYAFQEDLKTSLATVFIILWTYQLLIRKHKPYGLKRFNTMESTTIGVLMLNIILGYYTLNNPFSTLKYSAYGALAFVNILMLVWIFYKIVHMKIARYLDVAIEKFSSKKRERKSFLETSRASLLEKDHELTAEEEDMMFLKSKPVTDSDSKPINENHLL